MGRPHDCAERLRLNHNIKAIASELNISPGSVVTYLVQAVASDLIRKSELFQRTTQDERELFRALPSADDVVGDLFSDIRGLEIGLHRVVRTHLEKSYGTDEVEWWRKGIPEEVRIKCQQRRESDPDTPNDPYCYTDLLDLAKTMKKEWATFCGSLSNQYSNNRNIFIGDMEQLNRLRNKVMHPARGYTPTEWDFEFVARVRSELGSVLED